MLDRETFFFSPPPKLSYLKLGIFGGESGKFPRSPFGPCTQPKAGEGCTTTMTTTTRPLLIAAIAIAVGAIAIARFNHLVDLVPGVAVVGPPSFWSAASSPSSKQTCGLLDAASFAIRSERVVTPAGVVPATIRVEAGTIVEVRVGRRPEQKNDDGGDEIEETVVVDYGDLVVSPGLIDLHVHLNEPGREAWEGFATGTAAAAAGGVTTVIDMPLNSKPAATSAAVLASKMRRAQGKLHVNAGFWAGLVPENAHDPKELAAMLDLGAFGFKAFMSPSGIDDFGHANATDLTAGLEILSAFGRPLMVHAEQVFDVTPEGAPHEYATYMNTRPPDFERDAMRTLIAVSEGLGRRGVAHKIHVAHVADGGALADAGAYKKRAAFSSDSGSSFTVETCPHYLSLQAEDIADGRTEFKCAPPIRGAANRKALWEGLMEGWVDSIGSDHSPSPASLKQVDTGDFLQAWGGIAGLQYSLPATWSPGQPFGLDLDKLAELWSHNPARISGLSHDTGAIEVGKRADLVVWDDGADAATEPEALRHRHKMTPYKNAAMKGRVHATFVAGAKVFEGGTLASEKCGDVLVPKR